MEVAVESRCDDSIPPYEAWPSVPTEALPTHALQGDSLPMEVENSKAVSGPRSRDTSVLSMDDIEAAQALEGLRTGITNQNPDLNTR